MSVIEIRGGPLTRRQLDRWTRDRLIQEIRFVDNAILRLTGEPAERYQPDSVLRCWSKGVLVGHMLDRFRLYERVAPSEEGTD